MKKIEDYLNLYLGCEMLYRRMDDEPTPLYKLMAVSIDKDQPSGLDCLVCPIDKPEDVIWTSDLITSIGVDVFGNSWIKPLLRPLSDMSSGEEIEYKKLSKIPMDNLNNEELRKKDCMRVEAQATAYLLKQGFDLFGLIEDNIAIDKTTL